MLIRQDIKLIFECFVTNILHSQKILFKYIIFGGHLLPMLCEI